MKNGITFCIIWGFLGKNGSSVKDQEVSGKVSPTFSAAPYWGLTDGEAILIAAHSTRGLIPIKCRFLSFLIPLSDIGPLFRCHVQRMEKKSIWFPDAKFYGDYVKKII